MTNRKLSKALTAVSLMAALTCCLLIIMFAQAAENEMGAQVFDKRCKMCHGDYGTGNTKAGKAMGTPDITTADWKNGETKDDLVKTLKEGLGKMPPYAKKLNDEELTAVATFVLEKFRSQN